MKRIAFVFSTMPHGSASGREGLDALLATSALTEEIGVFFIGDGVFQILQGQKPDVILARDYIATFKLLGLYDIEQCWLCAACCASVDSKKGPVLSSRRRRWSQTRCAASWATTMSS